MATLATISVSYNGRMLAFKLEIPPEAHAYGVSGYSTTRRHIVPNGDITEHGAAIIEKNLDSLAENLFRELHGAWDTIPMF